MDLSQPASRPIFTAIANMRVPAKSAAGFLKIFGAYFVAVAVFAAFAESITFGIAKVLLMADTMILALPSKSVEFQGPNHPIPFDLL